jgi:hypothetical protein
MERKNIYEHGVVPRKHCSLSKKEKPTVADPEISKMGGGGGTPERGGAPPEIAKKSHILGLKS